MSTTIRRPVDAIGQVLKREGASWYIRAVDPALQGMGLGSTIVDATLKRIDEMGLPAYLENSNPRNTPLYKRAGFLARKNIAPEGAPPLIPMWRAVSQYR